jgi:lipoprotein-anchoring transpeptidase ErfK/SrfK
MSQVRTRRSVPTPSRIVALISASVVVLGLSVVGVAQAEDFRDRDGDHGYGGLLSSQRENPRSARPALEDRRQVRDRDADSEELDKLEPATPAGGLVAGTPCSRKAVACVSLKQKKSWLFTEDENGDIVVNHGPVPVSTGGPGKETPLGDYVVEWKDKNHKSGEYFVPHGCKPPAAGCEGAPMNWAVFFAEGGIAFHEGTLAIRSSGCVRLSAKEAEFYYNTLELGDKVEIRS